MHVIVCLDDKEGMLFHGRRQSRDRVVVGEILKRTQGRRLWMSPYSQPLFQGRMDGLLVDEGFLDKAAPGDFCFVEGAPLAPWKDKLESITLYRWNRHYPGDVFFDIDLKSGWTLSSRRDFSGHSHEKITEEVYLP